MNRKPLPNGDKPGQRVARARVPVYMVDPNPEQLGCHLPLALGMLQASCLGSGLDADYDFVPSLGATFDQLEELANERGPGVWVFSDYSWTARMNLELSELVKRWDAGNITVHGGPEAPKHEATCARFMRAHPHVDVVVRGEGERTFVELLETLARVDLSSPELASVAGLTYRTSSSAELVRTADRERISDLDALPSPYLTGVFDAYRAKVMAAIVETNRGCPYRCTFCDWGSATLQQIRRFSVDRVCREITWIAEQEIPILWIADANFGIFERDVEIAAHVAATRARTGFPREVTVNYAKNATERLSRIVALFCQAGICSQGIISIQTMDPQTLEVIDRKNIKTGKYEELIEIFKREGLPLSTDLMLKLPGATLPALKADLQYFFDRDVVVKAYPTTVLVNSPMGEPAYLERHRIETRGAEIVSTFSFTEAEGNEMTSYYAAFETYVTFACAKYVLSFLQWERGLLATDVLHRLATVSEPSRYPRLTRLARGSSITKLARVEDGGAEWDAFYAELVAFLAVTFELAQDDAVLWSVVRANRSLMPYFGRRCPVEVELAHDVVAYVRSHRRGERRPLSSFGPSVLEVEDPHGLCVPSEATFHYDAHTIHFELESALRERVTSRPYFYSHDANETLPRDNDLVPLGLKPRATR